MVVGYLEYRHATDVHGDLRCFHIEVGCVACRELPDGSRHFRRLPTAEIWAGFLTSLGTRVGHSERAMVAERPELAFRHREPIVSQSNPTIRRPEING